MLGQTENNTCLSLQIVSLSGSFQGSVAVGDKLQIDQTTDNPVIRFSHLGSQTTESPAMITQIDNELTATARLMLTNADGSLIGEAEVTITLDDIALGVTMQAAELDFTVPWGCDQQQQFCPSGFGTAVGTIDYP